MTTISPASAPVLLIVFRRPELTRSVWAAIRAANPVRVYVACDGPRLDKPGEAEQVELVRDVVDRDSAGLDIVRLYQPSNLGCGRGVSTAINWFFKHETEGIILEDDCLPDPSFFTFCSELLERYRDETNVMQVAGFNPLGEPRAWASDYVFSQYGWQWGWATWRRAWRHFDLAMSSWPEFKRAGLHRGMNFSRASAATFDKTFAGEVDTWDYQWAYAMASRWGVSAVPRVSLIQNIGLGDGTHYHGQKGRPTATARAGALGHPLLHPGFIVPDPEFDRALLAGHSPQHVVRRVLRRLRGMVGGPS
jgi:hypothetical protein